MGKAFMKFLSADEEELIHAHSLRSLEEFGVLIRSELVLSMLEDAGAKVEHDRKIAKIPEDMVNEAVRKAPREFSLCARDSKHDLKVPVTGVPYAATTGLASYMTDLETGERRNATRDDLADFARLADALEPVDFFWTPVVPMDVPDKSHATHQLWSSLQNTMKHVQQVEVMDAEDAKAQIDIAALIAGGRDELKKRPLFSVVSSPISPLSFEKGAIEAQVEFAKAGIPVVAMTMPLSGFTSPVTVAGTVNVVNVENLASLVISQCSSTGAPFVYSSAAVPADMKTGSVPSGSAELPALASALAQLARRYGLPCMIGGWGLCNGTKPGADSSLSEVANYVVEMFSMVDLTCGFGSLDSAKGASLEQMVIDAYTWRNFKPSLRSMKVDEASIALQALKDVGHGGTFISHPHTLRNFREAIAVPDLSKRAWEATLSYGMVEEARAITKRLLSEHQVPALDRHLVEQGDAIVERYEKG